MRNRITIDLVTDSRLTAEQRQEAALLVASAANANINVAAIARDTNGSMYFEAPGRKFRKERLGKVDKLRARVAEQRAWVERCGGNLQGYIAAYGYADEPGSYAQAARIWIADQNALDGMLADLADEIGPLAYREVAK